MLRLPLASGDVKCTAAAGRVELQCDRDFSAVDRARLEAAVEAFFAEIGKARGGHATLDRYVGALQQEFRDMAELEFRARDIVDRMALALQAALLVQHAPAAVADAFCGSRLALVGHHNYGTLPRGTDSAAIIERATPRMKD